MSLRDVHHGKSTEPVHAPNIRLTITGNGIQQAFWTNPNVLYISLHVHEDGNFYPAGTYGDHTHCGAGAGLGKYGKLMEARIDRELIVLGISTSLGLQKAWGMPIICWHSST